jgi:hypothetical protein
MVQVDDAPGQEKVIHQGDDTPSHGQHGVTRLTVQVQSHVATRDLAVELAAIAESAGDPVVAGNGNVVGPKAWSQMGLPRNLPGLRAIPSEPCLPRRVRPCTELGRHG